MSAVCRAIAMFLLIASPSLAEAQSLSRPPQVKLDQSWLGKQVNKPNSSIRLLDRGGKLSITSMPWKGDRENEWLNVPYGLTKVELFEFVVARTLSERDSFARAVHACRTGAGSCQILVGAVDKSDLDNVRTDPAHAAAVKDEFKKTQEAFDACTKSKVGKSVACGAYDQAVASFNSCIQNKSTCTP